ncbi:MAG TPA: 23S rRNA (pseudouridine(1915)-N(3))-methyltransferase RlmH [Candidatus Caccomorpha excrementavium]|nr:23S rRNA (pseudouridine(1915)-N(3))-methyltransferase RlmH [Candidatus Caccomorpha excrementavium]
MKIAVIGVGKLKEKYFVMAVEEYGKRLSRYCRLELMETADEKTPDGASPAEEERIKRLEGERILKAVREEDYVIALAIQGEALSSEELAQRLQELSIRGRRIVFIIGGSLGLHDSVLARADMRLSFSKMTFPHQLMRVVLLEQIYRSFRIIKGEPYHK